MLSTSDGLNSKYICVCTRNSSVACLARLENVVIVKQIMIVSSM